MHTQSDAAPDTGSYTDLPSRLLAEQVYATIKRRLLMGEVSLGGRLPEERLARELGASRTPVREALLRLHGEGLLVRFSGGGYSAAIPNLAEVRELYEVRIALERSALVRPCSTGQAHDRGDLEDLRAEWVAIAADPPEPTPDFVTQDEAFHRRLAAASGNTELVHFLNRVHDRIRIVRMRDFLTADRIVQTAQEHVALLADVIRGDLDAAVRSFDRHVARSLSVVEQRVAGALLHMANVR